MYYHVGHPQDYIELTHLPTYLPRSMIPRLHLLSRWVYYVFGLRHDGHLRPPRATIFSLASQCTYIPPHVKWLYIALWTSVPLTNLWQLLARMGNDTTTVTRLGNVGRCTDPCKQR